MGKSKGVVSSHKKLVGMARVLLHVWGREEVYMRVVLRFHFFGFSVFMCEALAAGATVLENPHPCAGAPAVCGGVVEGGGEAPGNVATSGAVNGGAAGEVVRCGEGLQFGVIQGGHLLGARLGREHVKRFASHHPTIKLSSNEKVIISGPHPPPPYHLHSLLPSLFQTAATTAYNYRQSSAPPGPGWGIETKGSEGASEMFLKFEKFTHHQRS